METPKPIILIHGLNYVKYADNDGFVNEVNENDKIYYNGSYNVYLGTLKEMRNNPIGSGQTKILEYGTNIVLGDVADLMNKLSAIPSKQTPDSNETPDLNETSG